MTQQLTPGRWRGLKTTSLSDAHTFGIVAFDQRTSYRKMLPENTNYADAVAIKMDVVRTLSRHASAVLLDPIYGLGPAMEMAGSAGLLLALEKSGYSGERTYRRLDFIPHWEPAKARLAGANGVKILVYYNPQNAALADELDDLLSEKVQAAHAQDLPIFIEPISYSASPDVPKDSAEFAAQKKDIAVETARRLSKTGVDVLKMEFPYDHKYEADEATWQKGCEEISQASSVPWALLSAGVDFETFERQAAIACAAGASGFLAGRAIWKEAVLMPAEERQRFLSDTATERLQRLLEVAATARPWTDFYSAPTSAENWFEQYP